MARHCPSCRCSGRNGMCRGMDDSRDTPFVGPAVANTVRECDGNVNMMSFWTFSDVFEEGGVIPKPFDGQFGLRAKGGINKPSYYDFACCTSSGMRELPNPSKDAYRDEDGRNGGLAIARGTSSIRRAWGRPHHGVVVSGSPGRRACHVCSAWMRDHSNVLKDYAAMGKPIDPTPAQVEQLNRETALGAPDSRN